MALLLDLPPEVRMAIWKHVFRGKMYHVYYSTAVEGKTYWSHALKTCRERLQQPLRARSRRPVCSGECTMATCPSVSGISLLLPTVCKRLHAETTRAIFLYVAFWVDCFCLAPFVRSLSELQRDALRLLVTELDWIPGGRRIPEPRLKAWQNPAIHLHELYDDPDWPARARLEIWVPSHPQAWAAPDHPGSTAYASDRELRRGLERMAKNHLWSLRGKQIYLFSRGAVSSKFYDVAGTDLNNLKKPVRPSAPSDALDRCSMHRWRDPNDSSGPEDG